MFCKFTKVSYADVTIEYGPFTRKGWYSIEGTEDPLFVSTIDDIKKLDLEGYKAYVLGGALEGWLTWDIDIALIGTPSKEAYDLMWKICAIGFTHGIYIDIQLKETIDNCILNCGGIDKWDGTYIPEMSYEITNYFSNSSAPEGNRKHYKTGPFGLWFRLIQYPFDKNIKRHQDGHKFRSPVPIEEL